VKIAVYAPIPAKPVWGFPAFNLVAATLDQSGQHYCCPQFSKWRPSGSPCQLWPPTRRPKQYSLGVFVFGSKTDQDLTLGAPRINRRGAGDTPKMPGYLYVSVRLFVR
jgi:hypothetical protein